VYFWVVIPRGRCHGGFSKEKESGVERGMAFFLGGGSEKLAFFKRSLTDRRGELLLLPRLNQSTESR